MLLLVRAQAALCTVAMSVCVLLLAASLNMAEAYVTDEEEAHFVLQCRDFAQRCHSLPCLLLLECCQLIFGVHIYRKSAL